MIQVQIVDDHKILAEGLVKIINESGVAQVIGTAHTAHACWKMLEEQQADVLLLDINLPDGNGIDLCPGIKAKYPSIKILALTSFSEYSIVRRMLDNGSSGYILKNAMAEEILEGIEVVTKGEVFLCEEVDMQMKKQNHDTVLLTGRERELLRLIADGYTNPEIAKKIFLGVETINSYRKNLLCKLGARNTAVLVKMAMEQRLI